MFLWGLDRFFLVWFVFYLVDLGVFEFELGKGVHTSWQIHRSPNTGPAFR